MYVAPCQAHISFSPTIEQQRKCPGCDATQIDGDFIIKYDVNRAETLGDIQVKNNYDDTLTCCQRSLHSVFPEISIRLKKQINTDSHSVSLLSIMCIITLMCDSLLLRL